MLDVSVVDVEVSLGTESSDVVVEAGGVLTLHSSGTEESST